MRKIFIGIITTVLCSTAICSSAYADSLSNSGKAANPITGRMNIVGEVDGEQAARVATIFILKPNTSLTNTNNSLYDNCLYVNTTDVDFDGSYEFEFDFNPVLSDDTKLPIYIVCGDKIYDYTYSYKSWDQIKNLFISIRNKNAVYTQLEEYFDTFGTDFSEYQHQKYQDELMKNINNLSNITDDINGINSVKECIEDTKSGLALLKDLQSQNNWAGIKSKITEIETSSGLEFSYMNSDPEGVCTALLRLVQGGKVFYTAKELQTEFNRLVPLYPKRTNVQGGGGTPPSVHVSLQTGSQGGGGGIVVNSVSFDDLPTSHWAYNAVDYLFKAGLVNGVSDKKYEPERNITREEFVKLAVCAFGIYNSELKADFEDTDADEWYSPYIASAKKEGLVSGISDTEFGIGRNITRQDMAVIIYNGLNKKGHTFKDNKVQFDDDASVDEYAKAAVSALAAEQIISGMGNGCFNPKDNATRAQAAQMIYALLWRNNV